MATEWTEADIESYVGGSSTATASAPRQHGIVVGSLLRGIDNLQASLYGAGALVADAADAIDTREWFLDGYLRNNREAAENPAEVASFRDIQSISDGFTYAIEGVMENLPTMVPAMVTGGGAAILAGAGRRALAAGIGAYAANWAQEAGGIYGDIKERTGINAPGTAATYGAAAAALDTASDLIGVGRLIGSAERKAVSAALGSGLAKEVALRAAQRLGKAGAKQFFTEGGTEAIQTAIEEAAVTHEDPTVPFWTSQTVDRIVDSAIKGGLSGGAFGVGAQTVNELTAEMAQTRGALDEANAALISAQEARDSGASQTASALEDRAISLSDVLDIPEPPAEEPATTGEPNATIPVGESASPVLGAQEAGPSGELGLPQVGKGNPEGQKTPEAQTQEVKPDKIEQILARALDATNPQGKVFDFVTGVSYAVAHTILRTVRAIYRTGKSVAESIKEAIKQHRQDNPGVDFDEAALEAKLNDVIQTEMAAVPEAPEQPQTTATPVITAEQATNPPKLTQALAFIKDPTPQYRTSTEKFWNESAARVINSFEGDLRKALNYVSRPPEMSGMTQDIAIVAASEIAQRAAKVWQSSANPVERTQARQVMRDATNAAKLLASESGQFLRSVQTAAKLFNPGTIVGEYEDLVSKKQEEKVPNPVVQAVVKVVKEKPSEKAKDKLVNEINKLRKKLGPVSWREIFGEARASQIDYARSIFRALTESRAGKDRDERVKIANQLSEEFWKEVARERAENAIRELDKLVAVKEPKKLKGAIAGAVPKLIRLANAGVLENEVAREAIAEKLGLKPFSEDTARRLYEEAQQAQRKPVGAQRDTAIRKVLNIIPQETSISRIELLKTAWYGGVLSGLATQSRNFIGSALNLANEFSALTLRSPQDVGRLSMALLRGFRDSATTEFGAIMRGAEPGRLNADVRQASLAAEILANDQSKWKRLLSTYRYVSRFMQAVDSLWYDAATEVKATFDAAAKGRLAKASDIDEYIQNELKVTKEDRARARSQAKEEIDAGLTDKRDLERRTIEITRQLRPADIQEDANRFALYSTFNNDPEGFLGLIYQMVIRARDKYPVLTALVPFARISANATNAFINASPLALIRLIGNRPDAMSLPLIGDKLRYGERRLTVEEWQQMRARILISGVATIGLAALAISTKDDKDPWFQITGSLKTLSPSRRQQLEEQGIRPYQVRIGGKGIDYKLSPLALTLAAIGNWSDTVRYGKDDPEAFTQLEAVLAAGHTIILDQSFLSGIGQLLEKPANNQGFFDKFQRFIAGTAGGFIPTVAKEVDSWVNPAVMQAKGFREQMQRQIPVARWFLERPLYNVLGEKVERPRYPWSWAVKGDSDDPVWKALAEKAAQGVFVPVVSAASKINGVKMTDQQFNRYQKLVGDLYRKKLEKDLLRFRQMNADQARKYFESEFQALRDEARARVR